MVDARESHPQLVVAQQRAAELELLVDDLEAARSDQGVRLAADDRIGEVRLGGDGVGLERCAAYVRSAAADEHAAAEPQAVAAQRQVMRDAQDVLLVPIERVVEADSGPVAEPDQV